MTLGFGFFRCSNVTPYRGGGRSTGFTNGTILELSIGTDFSNSFIFIDVTLTYSSRISSGDLGRT